MDDIKKELRAAELSEQAVEELLQILTVKSLKELEGTGVTFLYVQLKNYEGLSCWFSYNVDCHLVFRLTMSA